MEWVRYETHNSDSIPPRNSAVCAYLPSLKSLYVHGGSNDTDDFSDAHFLSLRTMTWTPSPASLEPMAGHSVCTKGDLVIVFGGWRKDHYAKDIHVFDGKNKFWYQGNSAEMREDQEEPWARRDQTMTMANEAMVFGGWNSLKWTTNDPTSTQVWQLDTNWHWHLCEVFGEPPQPRRGHSTTYDQENNTLIVFAGVYGYSRYLNDMYLFKLAENLWEPVTYRGPGPTARGYHSASLHQARLMVFGGLMAGDEVSNDLSSFSILNRIWTKIQLENGPPPSCGHCSLPIEDSVLIFGGMGESDQRHSFAQVYVLETNLENPFSNTLATLQRKTKLEELEELKIIPPPIPASLQKSRFYVPKPKPYDLHTFPKVG